MKNKDMIRTMSPDNLARFIHDISDGSAEISTCKECCDNCTYSDEYCIFGIKEWLEKEAGR